MAKKINVNNIIYFIGYILVNISLIMIINSYLDYKKNNLKIDSYTEINTKYDSKNIINNSEEYLGILEIPKINLKRGFYDFKSKQNNVNKNITILNNSTLPDTNNSILVLAAHSGNGMKSYFNKLDKLSLNDKLYIYYKDKKYIYQINDIYTTIKNGILNIVYNNTNQLILTTCDKKDKTKQLVIKAYMISFETY